MGALGIPRLIALQRETRLVSGTEKQIRIRSITGVPFDLRYVIISASLVKATTEYPALFNSAVRVIWSGLFLLIVITVFVGPMVPLLLLYCGMMTANDLAGFQAHFHFRLPGKSSLSRSIQSRFMRNPGVHQRRAALSLPELPISWQCCEHFRRSA